MSQSSADYFSHAFSGSLNERQMTQYQSYITQGVQQFSGWLGEQAKVIKEEFNDFLNSKAWEFSKRLLKKNDGEFVSSFEIGYLGTLSGLQNSTGLMRDYIMAHEQVMELYQAERIDGYNGEFSSWCAGLREENLFWRNAMSGVLTTKIVDEVEVLTHSHYRDTVQGELSFRERVDIHKTWNAITHHLANKEAFDITSKKNEKITPLE